ncbi:gamma subclass chorismate mutase AroQ [Thalassomonas actiniarum]|uniref:chorismate mutase n=1 Tax=Thalassomonas actiniarum TaxID=485447 RepID=A0AAF0C5U8_9GAMM|nr:gamma subclass chorismate mutase AroQ [Thalassomonas actiniarum]WDE01516.1 gamma subclass chorismate mutase AroQ [Thalassomonas actiniarum]
MKLLSKKSYLLLFICFFSPFSAFAQTQANEPGKSYLYQLINSRLGYMQAVALYKWQHQRAIEDSAREQVVIEKSVAKAMEQGLTSEEITPFFQIQITLAKKIQAYYHKRWSGHGVPTQLLLPENAPSLEKIRAELISLGADIITRLAATDSSKASHDFEQFKQVVQHAALDINDKAALFKALSRIKPQPYASRLDRILSEKILYVGTTGDYRPFSFYADNKRAGIDIVLARDLARTLGASAVFLPTSWPGLLADLGTGQYDIMMSGISKKLFRQQLGLFSDSYHSGGKTPISLCRKKHQYNSLEKIDHPQTRLIVNKGGTNQRFVNQHIKQAQVLVHGDNTTVFEQILAGRADVMITDKIEVAVQAKNHPQLCGTMNGTLSYSAKAFLLGRDLIWLEYVDTWLEQVKNDGTLKQVFEQYL